MAGTPPVTDRAYTLAHPDWRGAYHRMRENILIQYRADRESCKRIRVRDQWHDSAGLTLSQLEELADQQARHTLERAVRRREDIIEAGRGL